MLPIVRCRGKIFWEKVLRDSLKITVPVLSCLPMHFVRFTCMFGLPVCFLFCLPVHCFFLFTCVFCPLYLCFFVVAVYLCVFCPGYLHVLLFCPVYLCVFGHVYLCVFGPVLSVYLCVLPSLPACSIYLCVLSCLPACFVLFTCMFCPVYLCVLF